MLTSERGARALMWLAIAACTPYLVLKLLWLSGQTIGIRGASGVAEMADSRHVVGNVVTVGLELCAIVLAAALSSGWGRKLPAVVVVLPMWVATGLLAPIALGLAVGLAVQGAAGGSPIPADQGLYGWVFALVYGGFAALGTCLALLFIRYARARWPQVRAHAVPRTPAAVVAAAVVGCYGVALCAWSVGGTAWGGPAGFTTAAQRTTLAATGVLTLVGVIAVFRPWIAGRWRLVAVWIGTSVSVLAGPTHVLLSNKAQPGPVLLVSAVAAAVAGAMLTRAVLRARPQEHRTALAPTPQV